MNQSLEQTLRHLQVPQQRLLQVMKFLQLTSPELDVELRAELERNPALVMKTSDASAPSTETKKPEEEESKGEPESAFLSDPSRNLMGGQGFRIGRGGDGTSAKMEAMANTPDMRATFQDQMVQRFDYEESNPRKRGMASYLAYSMSDNGYLMSSVEEIARTMDEAVERNLRQSLTNLLFLLRAEEAVPSDWPGLRATLARFLDEVGTTPEDTTSALAILEKLHTAGVDIRACAEAALKWEPPASGTPTGGGSPDGRGSPDGGGQALDVRKEILTRHLRDVGLNRLGKITDALLALILEWDNRLRGAILQKLNEASQASVQRRKEREKRERDPEGRLEPVSDEEAVRPQLDARRAFVDAIHDPKVQDAFAGMYWIMEKLVAAKSQVPEKKEEEPETEVEDEEEEEEGESSLSSAEWLLGETTTIMTHYYPLDKIYVAEDGTILPPRRWGLRDAAERKRVDIDSLLLDQVYRTVEALRAGVLAQLDRDGRLTAACAEVLAPTRVSPGELEGILLELQRLGPAGVGARSTVECLLLQLDEEDPEYELKRRLIQDHMADIEKNRLPQIVSALDVDLETVKRLIGEVRKLAPKPANALASNRVPPVNPDVVVEWVDDRYEVRLTRSYRDRLFVNPIWRRLLEDKKVKGKERQFAREKVQSARTFIEFIVQREIITEKICRHVVDQQKEFFEKGIQGLKALTMTEVARQIGVDPATVSRAVRGRYMQTPRGIFPVRYFFSEGMTSSRSGEEVASEGLRAIIREYVEKEDKKNPLDDGAIARMLETDHGIKVARRTVREYRTRMNILKASQRKQY